MRIVIGKISHETTTFSVIPTDMDAFKARGYYRGPDIIDAFAGTNTPLGGFIDAARSVPEMELVPTVAADATPAGRVTRDAFNTLRDELVNGIRNAGELDGVLLQLHGAMVTEDHEDGEGVLLSAVREEVGEDLPIVTTLDLHGNITRLMVDNTDAFFGYDTNPHVDGHDRGVEALSCLLKIIAGEWSPVMARSHPPLMPHPICVRTDSGPLADLLKLAYRWEERPGVINVSVFGGWPHADIEDAGVSFLAVTDGDGSLAGEIVKDLHQQAMARIPEFVPSTLVDIEEAVARGLASPRGPVILAEIGDSPAGGSSGDGTYTLRRLLEVGADSVAILVKDTEAVARALEVGVGGQIDMDVGGKTDDVHGSPVRVRGTVRALTDGRFVNRGPMATGVRMDVGRTAVIRVGRDFELLLTEKRISPVDPQVFRQAGVEPADKQIVVLKSGGHFRAAYTTMAHDIIDVNTPGVTCADLRQVEYRRVKRPVFPLDNI